MRAHMEVLEASRQENHIRPSLVMLQYPGCLLQKKLRLGASYCGPQFPGAGGACLGEKLSKAAECEGQV